MAEQFLEYEDVTVVFVEVRGEGMTHGMSGESAGPAEFVFRFMYMIRNERRRNML